MKSYYNVAPRFTGGSPAMVDPRTALRVLLEEWHAWSMDASGHCGPLLAERAIGDSLEGIVEAHFVYATHVEAVDIITGRVSLRGADAWTPQHRAGWVPKSVEVTLARDGTRRCDPSGLREGLFHEVYPHRQWA